MSNTDIIFHAVQNSDGSFDYSKAGTVEETLPGYFVAYNLSDISVYEGESFIEACAVLRGEQASAWCATPATA